MKRRVPAILPAVLLWACAGTGPLPPTGTPAGAPTEGADAPPAQETDRAVATLPRVGVVVALEDADLGGFAARVLEGVRLAVEERGGGVDLVVEETGGAAGVTSAERGGALIVIGPLDEADFVAAAGARADGSLVLVSPIATRTPTGMPNVYALNAEDVRGAEALAAWAVERGMRSVGILFPSIPAYMAQAEAFRAAAEAAGVRVVAHPFAPGTTTFSVPLKALAGARVQALFVPAGERDVRQIAPQVRYYGLEGVRLLGNDTWVSPPVLRGMDPAMLEGMVAATPLDAADEAAWDDFARRYESRFRRTLDSPVPALGHDAALLVLEALAGSGDRAEVARRFAALSGVRGATGLLTVRDGRVTRQPHLVMVRDGRTVPVGR